MGQVSLVILGSTGSIGRQTLDVVRAHRKRLRVVGLAAGAAWEELARQAEEFSPEAVALADERAAERLRPAQGGRVRVLCGGAGLEELAQWPGADTVVVAIAGVAALRPMLAAMRAGKRVAFATKEPLVAAGELIVAEARRLGVELRPIDSEISAIWQCLRGEDRGAVRWIWLTASGGPFRTLSLEQMREVSAADALQHPTWSMGAKITIDSATLMNKGLEVIEASRLFGISGEKIRAVIHPQSIVHSMVEFADGSVLAQLGWPDMRLPIQYALLGPERPENPFSRWNPWEQGKLEFEPPDTKRFPCLALAYEALAAGGTMPTVMNAANEVANAAFIAGEIGFLDIPRLIGEAMEAHEAGPTPNLEAVEAADRWARAFVRERLAPSGGRREEGQ